MCGGNMGHDPGSKGDYHEYKSHQDRENYSPRQTEYSRSTQASYSLNKDYN